MKHEKAERIKEKEEDKELRAKEREHDMKVIQEIISKGVQREVEAAVLPISERQLHLEQEQAEIKEKLSNLYLEMQGAKQRYNFPPLSTPPSLAPTGSPRHSSLEKTIADNLHKSMDNKMRQARQLAGEAKKIIGLNKIDREDVERVSRMIGAEDEVSAYRGTIKEYFKQEMRIGEEVFNSLNIRKVFPPARENWDTLYVECESETDINIIFKYAKNLKKNQRLVRYIPHEFYDRFRAMEADAYLLRHSEPKFKTRIKMGINDLVLYKRIGSGNWTIVPSSEDWPAMTLSDEHMN